MTDVAKYKVVDGQLVELTEQEKQEIEARWAEEEAKKNDPVHIFRERRALGKQIIDAFFEYLAGQVASSEKLEWLADNCTPTYILLQNGSLETALLKVQAMDFEGKPFREDDRS